MSNLPEPPYTPESRTLQLETDYCTCIDQRRFGLADVW